MQSPGAGLALRQSPLVSAHTRTAALRRRPTGAVRMQEEPKEEGVKVQVPPAVDPYAVKKEVPSWAKEDNQVTLVWKIVAITHIFPCVKSTNIICVDQRPWHAVKNTNTNTRTSTLEHTHGDALMLAPCTHPRIPVLLYWQATLY